MVRPAHQKQSANGCVTCERRWSEHTAIERGEGVVKGYPEGTRLYVADMDPIERAYAEAMHEDCTDGDPHPLTAHEPWSGGDLDSEETWQEFTARLFRHGLTLTLDPVRSATLRSALDPKWCPRCGWDPRA